MTINIVFSKRFLKDAKNLRKKYYNIDKDLLSLVNDIENGKIIGDRLKSINGLVAYKARVKNSSIKSGKSGGFRVIYYIEIKAAVYFITIYSKSEQESINSKEIINILKEEHLI